MFEISCENEVPVVVHLSAMADGYAEKSGTLVKRLVPAGMLDVGDLHLALGLAVSGRVTSGDGSPIPDTGIIARPQDRSAPPEANPALHEPVSVHAATDDDGVYRFSDLAAGIWDLRVVRPGIVGDVAGEVDGRSGGALRLDFVVRLVAPIEGRVVSMAGVPLRDVRVQAFVPDDDVAVSQDCVTDAAGRFVLRRRSESRAQFGGGGPVPVGVEVDVRIVDGRHRPVSVRSTWGAKDVTLATTSTGVLRLRVVALESGEPVVRYCYRLGDADRLGNWYAVEAADGVVEIPMPWDGASALLAVMPPAPHRSIAQLELGVPEGLERTFEVRVPRAPIIRVEVTDESSRPVTGALVRLVSTPLEVTPEQCERIVSARANTLDLGGSKAWSWDEARSDSSGIARLLLPDLRGRRAWVVVDAAGKERRSVAVGDGPADVRVVLDR